MVNAYGNYTNFNKAQLNALEAFENSGAYTRYVMFVKIPNNITPAQLENMGWFDGRETQGFAVKCSCGKRILSGCSLGNLQCKACGAKFSIANPQIS